MSKNGPVDEKVPVLCNNGVLRFSISEGGGTFSDLEKEIYEYLVSHYSEYVQHYLADLSWAEAGWREKGNDGGWDGSQTTVDFFLNRRGRSIFNKLPEELKNKILASAL